jgi:hypothetical protein
MALAAPLRAAAWWLALTCLGALTIAAALHLATMRRISAQLQTQTETVETLSYVVRQLEGTCLVTGTTETVQP